MLIDVSRVHVLTDAEGSSSGEESRNVVYLKKLSGLTAFIHIIEENRTHELDHPMLFGEQANDSTRSSFTIVGQNHVSDTQ